jgi:starch phosphorylase
VVTEGCDVQRLKRQLPHVTSEENVSALADAIRSKLTYVVGRAPAQARPHDWFMATALAARDRIVDRWFDTETRVREQGRKRVYYLSVEFLIGRLLFDALTNLGLVEPFREALATFGVDFADIRKVEPDAALGNGGLGRLAACFMDSLATLGIAAYGYGIRYDFGLFRQQIRDGWQHELPEDWLTAGNPWEFERQDVVYPIRFGGAVEYVGGDHETARALWYPTEVVNAVAHDTPIVGWRARHVNTLRLWSARAIEPIHLYAFNQGDFVGALASRAQAEAISRVLYPADETVAGQELRLRQEFFFTSASLQDIVQRHLDEHESLASLPKYVAIQMNDTHPAIAVAELMRILVDEHESSWPEAWRITRETLSYTNHTLLPEALETWPVALMNRLLPRHMQIIYLINWQHLTNAAGHSERAAASVTRVSLVQEGEEKRVRMGHLAFIGSHKVNGVSALHTDLLRKTVFADLDHLYPGRIVNKTNGITFRRWLFEANPKLTALMVETLGVHVLDDVRALADLESFADDPMLVERYVDVRRANKEALARLIARQVGMRIDPSALFDVQIKRIHEYKRQLLNVLEAIALYQAIHSEPDRPWIPRVKIFAGKAAANYVQAKLIIKLASEVARAVNADPVVGKRLKIIFLPNYNVSCAELIVPAADLSEQISTAGMEASGTGNMKLALNGALTIGTLDGANVEIRDHVGADNMFIFGLQAHEVAEKVRAGFLGSDAVAASPRLKQVIDSIGSDAFSSDGPELFRPIVDKLMAHDKFMVAADFEAYWLAQRAIDDLWRNPTAWWRASILNTARTSWFSSDRVIREYAEDIWRVPAS